jgi:hypothetical protein
MRQPVRSGLGRGDEFVDRPERRWAGHHQAERARGHEGNGIEILHRIVGQLLEQIDVRDQSGRGGEVEGVAIGRGPGSRLRADDVLAARLVEDHHHLAPHMTEAVGQQTGDVVRTGARRLREDDVHRLVGPRLRPGGRKRQGTRDNPCAKLPPVH